MESSIPMPISWEYMGIKKIPLSGLYSLINFNQGYKIKTTNDLTIPYCIQEDSKQPA